MDFDHVIDNVLGQFDDTNLRYALIGGFAMAMRGVQRATIDLDLLLLMDDRANADSILRTAGYECFYQSENVSHYRGASDEAGRIDLLHAFRTPSVGMLDRAERLSISTDRTIPVLQTEDIIGLKIQSAVNDPQRERQDWGDIELLLQAATYQGQSIDWELIRDYLEVFELTDKLPLMQNWYGQTD